jgi:hypothetical protein
MTCLPPTLPDATAVVAASGCGVALWLRRGPFRALCVARTAFDNGAALMSLTQGEEMQWLSSGCPIS